MILIRFILAFSLITFLVLLSQSLPTSASDDGAVLVPFRRSVLLQSQPMKAGEKMADVADDLSSFQPRKLGVHIKKAGRGGVTGSTGRRTSSAVRTQLSSFHFSSVLGCSLFLGLIMLQIFITSPSISNSQNIITVNQQLNSGSNSKVLCQILCCCKFLFILLFN